MPPRSSRNVLAAVMIVLGALMVVSSPLNAEHTTEHCGSIVVNFDDHDPRPLYSRNPVVGPVALTLPAGTYDIVMTSFDPGHGKGRFLNQLHESWYFTLDNGYVSPVTPDFPDSEMSTAIARTGVELTAATEITAFWAGVEADIDSVHATVSFTCTRATIATTTPTTIAASTTTAVTTTTSTSAAPTPTTVLGAPTPVTPTTVLTPTTLTSATTTTQPVGQIGDGGEDPPEELAFTGINLQLAIGGVALIAAGFGLLAAGAAHDRRSRVVVGP